ncbi:MerR family transcriptional regulator [Agromyces sp. NPDC004153]
MEGHPLRTADVARASGDSLQQVRDLERLGVIPRAARAGNGYRAYGPIHVAALRAYRALAFAAGPVFARQVLADAWRQSMSDAAASIGDVHVQLARQRDEVLQARRALAAIRAEAGAADAPVRGSTDERDAMSITELAGALDVRTSTLRFWEHERLVHPDRITPLRARHYAPHAVREARIVAALRRAGYGIPAVRELMGALGHADGLGEADRILQVRLDRIAARSVALLRAGSDLADVLDDLAADPATPTRGPT